MITDTDNRWAKFNNRLVKFKDITYSDTKRMVDLGAFAQNQDTPKSKILIKNPLNELTKEQLDKYEREYMDYLEHMSKRISARFRGFNNEWIIMYSEKMIIPFVFWLQNKISLEDENSIGLQK